MPDGWFGWNKQYAFFGHQLIVRLLLGISFDAKLSGQGRTGGHRYQRYQQCQQFQGYGDRAACRVHIARLEVDCG